MKKTLIQKKRYRPSLITASLNALVVIVLSLLTVGLFTSCSDDDLDKIKGNSWYLEKADYNFGGTYIFSHDDVVIDFKSNGKFIVKTKENVHHLSEFFYNGNHTYSINSSKGTITIDGKVYRYYFDSGQLIIEYKPEVDGPVFYLKKL